jgi:ketosteroid isomerase-like protein
MVTNQQNGEIESIVREMNRAWTGSWDEKKFAEFIHPDAVAIVPTTPGRLEGRDQYVTGWKSFAGMAQIHEWVETSHRVTVYASGICAVVTYFFTIRFAIGGNEQLMKGRDMLFLVKEQGRWLVAADQFSPEPVQT